MLSIITIVTWMTGRSLAPEGFKIALELTAQQTPLAKGVDAERFIDPSLLRELERSGFFAVSGGAK